MHLRAEARARYTPADDLRNDGERIDTPSRRRLDSAMKTRAAIFAVLLWSAAAATARQAPPADDFRQLTSVTPLPRALDRNFEFRKTKLFVLGDTPNAKLGGLTQGAAKTPTIGVEANYRLHGAVSGLESRQRYGPYMDFFWRVKRPANVTVRLEYRQEKLRAFTQAREVYYPNARGSHKTAFAIIGDDFFNDGRILSWRCLLVANGRIVAEERSFLWR